MTVFVIQDDPHKSFRDAENFGKLEFLFGRDVFPGEQERVQDMVDIAYSKLKCFNPRTDYVLLVGDPVGIAVSTAVLSEFHNEIPVLKWDKQQGQYFPLTITLDNREEI